MSERRPKSNRQEVMKQVGVESQVKRGEETGREMFPFYLGLEETSLIAGSGGMCDQQAAKQARQVKTGHVPDSNSRRSIGDGGREAPRHAVAKVLHLVSWTAGS